MGEFATVPKIVNPDGSVDVTILCFRLPRSTTASLLVCGTGIMACYCLSSIAQEFVYQTGFTASTFLTLVAKLTAALWGVMMAGKESFAAPKCSQQQHAAIGILSFGTMWLSNESLRYLNYPTQSIFKSAKLIPVMLASTLILRKRYIAMEYASAIALFLGLVLFTLGDLDVSPSFSFTGVAYICGALVCDAVIGTVQEGMFKTGAGSNEMMVLPNVWSAVLSLVACIAADELSSAIKFVLNTPTAVVAILGYSGFNIIGAYPCLAT
jgi:drug/metabolite transporter (DMT)-like permease